MDFDDDEEDEVATQDCPYCQAEIFDDAVQCPHCGQYLSSEDAPAARQPTWVILTALACLVMILYWIFGPAL